MATVLSSPKRIECHTTGLDYLRPANACEYHFANPDWALLGNSHGAELAYALADELRGLNKGLKHLTFSACPPSFGRTDEKTVGCSNWTQEAINYIAENEHIKNVVISYRTHGLLPDGRGEQMFFASTDEFVRGRQDETMMREKRWASYVDTVKYFVEANKNVFVILQAPELPRHVEFFVNLEEKDFGFVSGVRRSWWNESSMFFESRLSELPKEATVIDPAELFCDYSICAAIKDGSALYWDYHHMSIAGGALIARHILRRAGESQGEVVTARE